jgi:hypothetical protein
MRQVFQSSTYKVQNTGANRINLKTFLTVNPPDSLNDIRTERSDMMLLSQLVQELVGGTLRRNVFTQIELQLLLDLQACRIRKSTKADILRRYLKAVQQHSVINPSIPLRFLHFFEREQHRLALQSAERAERLLEARSPVEVAG